jgi:hypothetical protein|tara:strand:- start:845 stop:1060 length:216 start_codon:yes stop_codon:yes gene_type:complete
MYWNVKYHVAYTSVGGITRGATNEVIVPSSVDITDWMGAVTTVITKAELSMDKHHHASLISIEEYPDDHVH